MRWPLPKPEWKPETKRAYRNMILATRRVCVACGVTPEHLMRIVADRVQNQNSKNDQYD